VKKVLILTNNDKGLYNFRRELIEKLNSKYEVYISSPYGEFIDYFTNIGCHFIKTEFDRKSVNPIQDFKLLLTYNNIMKDLKPDVLLTYTIKPNVYGGIASQILDIPYLPNITGFGTAVSNTGVLSKITTLLYQIGLKNAHHVFFQNKENLDYAIKNNILNSPYTILPGSGVNLKYFSVLEYPHEDQGIHFLFISRIMEEKGIDQYLDAAEYIKSKYQFTNFHILGALEGNYKNKLMNMEKRNLIIYHGRQPDVRKYHQVSHCTIHPTYYPEGMSNVLLESASSGRPIITTNRSGTKEIVDDEKNGYLIREKDSKDLIEKIEKFLNLSNRERKIMGLKGREKVVKEFDRNDVINFYLDEINMAIK